MKKNQQVKRKSGQVICEIRMAKHMKQAEFAERINMDETYISDLGRGNYMPSLYTLLKFSKGLGVSIEDFVS